MNIKKIIISAITASAAVLLSATCGTTESANIHDNTTKSIGIGFNKGTTIVWDEADYRIKKVWLDNITFAVLDFDGCVKGFKGCEKTDATSIHINRIKDLKIKKIPHANSTQMTVIVENLQTQAKEIHFFDIQKTNATTQKLVRIKAPKITPNPIPAPIIPPPKTTGKSALELAGKIRQAIKVEGIDRKTRNRWTQFANLLELGTPEAQAINLLHIDPNDIEKILSYETTQNP